MTRTGKDPRGQLRIIGGQWRGRKLQFSPADGLRPTPDRIRETLFNWLTPYLQGARVADLFAGSGALGLEAISRGAAQCDFVDSNRGTLAEIGKHLELLQASGRGRCHPGSALDFLEQADSAYDIVFIDPPFNRQLVSPTCALLSERSLLHSEGLVYIEASASELAPEVPIGWTLHRDKLAGAVAYRLYRA